MIHCKLSLQTMSSFLKETVNYVNQKCSSCEPALHLYPNNQLFLKNMRVSEASRYTQTWFDWCILNNWKMCFSMFWHQTDPCTSAPGMWFLILKLRFESTKWCLFLLMCCCIKRNYACELGHSKKRLHVLHWAGFDYQDKVCNKMKAVSGEKKCNSREEEDLQK